MISFTPPTPHICTFVLGCALIHATRAHAATVTRVLAGAAILLAVLVLFGASLACAPDNDLVMDDVRIFNGA